jgi:hypothetical protein
VSDFCKVAFDGNGTAKLNPGIKPKIIQLHNQINRSMLPRLLDLKVRYKATDKNSKRPVLDLLEIADILDHDYNKAVGLCGELAKAKYAGISDAKEYYWTLWDYLSASADGHTLLPFFTYLSYYYNNKSFEGEDFGNREWTVSFTMDDLWKFIGRRLEESIMVCEAYGSLVAAGMDTAVKKIDLAKMANWALETQLLVAYYKSSRIMPASVRGYYEPEEAYKRKSWEDGTTARILQEYRDNTSFSKNGITVVETLPSMAYYIIEHTYSNAFKAAFMARHAERMKNVNYRDRPGLAGRIDLGSLPKVSVSLRSGEWSFSGAIQDAVIMEVKDNGVGIPNSLLDILFDPAKWVETGAHHKTEFAALQWNSKGRSMRLFPYLSTLAQIAIEVKTEEGKGTVFTIAVAKKWKTDPILEMAGADN